MNFVLHEQWSHVQRKWQSKIYSSVYLRLLIAGRLALEISPQEIMANTHEACNTREGCYMYAFV